MSGYVFELTFHAVCMSLGCDDPMLGLQGPARRAWGASPGWLMAALMRDTIIHTVTLMQTPRKTTQHKCIKHTYANVSIRFHSVKCFFLLFLSCFFVFVFTRLDACCQPHTKMLLICTMNCLVTVSGSLFVFLQQTERNVDFKMQLSQSEAAGGT